MSNNIHLILSAREGFEPAAIIRDMKKYTRKIFIAAIETNIMKAGKNG